MKILLAVLVVLTMADLSSAQQPQTPADVLFVNGDISTGPPVVAVKMEARMDGTKPSPPPAPIHGPVKAIAVSKGEIVAIGSNDDIQKLKGPKTQVIDLGGHFVMPGFNDAHVHLGSGGFEKLNVNLVGSKSLEEMKQRIATRAKTAGAGEWIQGRGWDHTLWAEQKTPMRSDI